MWINKVAESLEKTLQRVFKNSRPRSLSLSLLFHKQSFSIDSRNSEFLKYVPYLCLGLVYS